jgi:acyl-CoA thioesterase II
VKPVAGLVRVCAGATPIAETRAALVTALPEANGQIVIPERDVLPGALAPLATDESRFALRPGGTAVAWRAGEGLLGLDPALLHIVVDDRWPGRADGAGTVNRFPRWGDVADLLRIMDVVPAGPGLYVAPAHEDRRRNVVEGSQLLGQAIIAAAREVPGQRAVSAHMIFSRPARFDLPLFFRVTKIRTGRSFSTLSVEATQEDKSVASALVLTDKGAPDKIRGQIAMPAVTGPDASPFHDYGMTGRDVRFVDGAYTLPAAKTAPPEIYGWVRHREAPDERCLRQALLAQFTGHMTISASLLPHAGLGEEQAHFTLSTGVLAITVAMHDEADLTRWLLYANPSIYAGRGLVQGEGRVFGEDGRLVASYTVQAMVRDFAEPPEWIGLDQSRLM